MLNNVVLMGRICRDIVLKQTQGGVSVTTLRLAVERPTTEKKADFVDVVAWRQTADFISRFFRKGSMIAVVGSLQSRDYEDKNGNKRSVVEVVAERVSFCGREETKEQDAQQEPTIEEDDGLPF